MTLSPLFRHTLGSRSAPQPLKGSISPQSHFSCPRAKSPASLTGTLSYAHAGGGFKSLYEEQTRAERQQEKSDSLFSSKINKRHRLNDRRKQ